MLGTGDVGKALAKGFVNLGHTVKFGTRDPQNEKAKKLVSAIGATSSAGTFAEAAAFGEIVVLATLWSGTENAIKLASSKNLDGKTVIEATNPVGCPPGALP